MLDMEQIAQRLAAAGLGVIGKTIFAHRMPETAKIGLVALSRAETEEIDGGLGSYRRGTFQVIARAASYPAARQAAQKAMAAMMLSGWQTLPPGGPGLTETAVLMIRPQHEPVLFPVSDGDLVEASVDFEFACA